MLRKLSQLSFLIILAVVISSCGNKQAAKSEQQYMQEAQAKVDAKQYEEAIAIYREYITAYPKSEGVHDAYNKIAGYYLTELKNTPEGIKAYKEHAEKYPDTKQGKNSLFLVAFTYDEVLKDKDNAIKAYEVFLAKYPNDTDPNEKFSESARVMLENLKSGTSIEEMIKKIESQNPPSTDTTTKVSPDVQLKKVEPENTTKSPKQELLDQRKELEKKK
ncbi:MAG TPA: tetratricopeptide repeat protein [Ignavibacteria bacterium]|nr:tetratricopeptide repeat protein [Ignavibacteria bacterium]